LAGRRLALAIGGAVLGLLAVWSLVDLIRIQRDVQRGEDGLRGASAADMARPRGVARLSGDALRRFQRADRIAHKSPALGVARRIPLLGQQIAALRSVTRTAVTVGRIGDDAARAVQARLENAHDAAGRVALMETATAELSKAKVRLRDVRVPKTRWVLPPMSGTRDHLESSLDTARTKLDDISTMAEALKRMFTASRVLILAGNNAEMRAGPMPLSAGVAGIVNGAMRVGKFVPTHSLWRGFESRVPHSKELENLYGWMVIGAEWRATTATPNFPASAAMYEQMAPQSGLGQVDSVMFVDAIALKAVVDATGPVVVDDLVINADNIVREILNENYIRFRPSHERAVAGRYDFQSEIGVAVFDALNSRPLRLGKLVANLSLAGKGRHILAWSKDKELQRVWRDAGISGAVKKNGLMVAIQNIGANKLDYYLRPRVTLKTLWVRRGIRRVEMSVYFKNPERDIERTSGFIEGTLYAMQKGFQVGEYRAYLVAHLPHSAADVASADPPFTTAGTDAGMKVVGFQYGVKPGDSRTVKITFSVPKEQVFELIPAARVQPVPYATADRTYSDATPVTFKL
jgi:hypothetical protein